MYTAASCLGIHTDTFLLLHEAIPRYYLYTLGKTFPSGRHYIVLVIYICSQLSMVDGLTIPPPDPIALERIGKGWLPSLLATWHKAITLTLQWQKLYPNQAIGISNAQAHWWFDVNEHANRLGKWWQSVVSTTFCAHSTCAESSTRLGPHCCTIE